MTQGSAPSGASWRSVAIASGACAAFNGVFAKLYADSSMSNGRIYVNVDIFRTTDDLTSSWAESMADSIGLGVSEKSVEVIIRGVSWDYLRFC